MVDIKSATAEIRRGKKKKKERKKRRGRGRGGRRRRRRNRTEETGLKYNVRICYAGRP